MRDDRIEHHVTTIGNHETPEKNSLNEQVHGLVERLKLVMRYIYTAGPSGECHRCKLLLAVDVTSPKTATVPHEQTFSH